MTLGGLFGDRVLAIIRLGPASGPIIGPTSFQMFRVSQKVLDKSRLICDNAT